MFELCFEGDDIIERSESISRDILLTGFPQLEVAFLPEVAFLLGLLKLIMGGLQVVQEHSGLRDERLDDLLEGSGVLFVEVTANKLLF